MEEGVFEVLSYARKIVNEWGHLIKKFLIGDTKPRIYLKALLRRLCKTSINVSSNACDVDALVLIPGRNFHDEFFYVISIWL